MLPFSTIVTTYLLGKNVSALMKSFWCHPFGAALYLKHSEFKLHWNGDIYYCQNMSKSLNFLSRIYQKHLHWNVNACPCQILNKEKCKESWVRKALGKCPYDVMKVLERKSLMSSCRQLFQYSVLNQHQAKTSACTF